MNYILNLFILLYIILIFIAWYYKIRSFWIAFLVIIINLIFILFGWFIRVNKKKDFSNECIISYNNNNKKKEAGVFYNGCIDYWHFLHILLYTLVGVLFPNNYIIIFFCSTIWEIIEHFSFKYIMKVCSDKICGRIEDIFLNIFGYLLGNIIIYI